MTTVRTQRGCADRARPSDLLGQRAARRAAAFVLDEPASPVVDVIPTGPARRTAIRSLALLAPLAAGAVLMLASALRGLALPWAATGLALAGNVVLGFAVTRVARTRTGGPGRPASATVMVILMAPSLLPPVARRVSTFPTSSGGLSSNTVWWTVLAVCVAAVAVSVNGRRVFTRTFRSAPRPMRPPHRQRDRTPVSGPVRNDHTKIKPRKIKSQTDLRIQV